ncbi:alpha/beta fold hydrolase [Amycolatopsis sp. cmx-4-68]|uniref:alpha/beta fold hydrolase n=1 Tax=Amycolatopsis sp. cmx-4-68 TaxID=2790938 RepID=UPI0039788FDE
MGKPAEYFPFELDTDPRSFGMVSGFYPGPFGLLHYLHSTADHGSEATVLLHGVANDWTTWTPFLRLECERSSGQRPAEALRDFVLVDLPGFGRSDNSEDHLNSRQVGDLLIALVRQLGFDSVRLVGHSMGGFLALDIAVRYPAEVSSVHLVAGAYFSVIRTVQSPWLSLMVRRKVAVAYFSQSALAMLGPVGPPLIRVLAKARLLPLSLRGFLAFPWSANRSFLTGLARGIRPKSFLLAAQNGSDYDPDVEWSKIRCPVVGVFGEKDKLVPVADMVDLRRVCDGVETHLIDSCAHFPHVEMPHQAYDCLFGRRTSDE